VRRLPPDAFIPAPWSADLERVRAAGMRNLSIDLIAGMPHQTAASWQESLEVLAATGVEHASIYMLEIDEDSRLGRELLAGGSRYHARTVPSEELTADLYESAIAFLGQNGLRQYEISNFARSECQSRHNLKYWRRQPYLGFGLDAHSMLRTPLGSALRFSNTAVLAEYLRGPEDAEEVRRSARRRSWRRPGSWACACMRGSHGRLWRGVRP
jgi:oxygen-independent coproporphyrinogen-3 oxidase